MKRQVLLKHGFLLIFCYQLVLRTAHLALLFSARYVTEVNVRRLVGSVFIYSRFLIKTTIEDLLLALDRLPGGGSFVLVYLTLFVCRHLPVLVDELLLLCYLTQRHVLGTCIDRRKQV